MKKFDVQTGAKEVFVDITGQVEGEVRRAGVKSGACVVYAPHTTAAVTINENGRLVLGTWQGIFFCEFDGPRRRHVFVQLLGNSPLPWRERTEVRG